MEIQIPEIIEQTRAYIAFRRAEGLRESTLDTMQYTIQRIARDCGFNRLQDATEEAITKWFVDSAAIDPKTEKAIRSPNTRKSTLIYITAFFEWAVSLGLIEKNPCSKAPRPKKYKSDRRKFRRAITAKEFETLLHVAKYHALALYALTRTPRWAKSTIGEVNVENVQALAQMAIDCNPGDRVDRYTVIGEKWVLAYRLAAFTGLRWGEIRALRVSQIDTGDTPRILLHSSQTKNGESDVLPLNRDVANAVRQWVKDRQLQPSDILLANLPEKGVNRFYRHLKMAKIPRCDAAGRSLDVHALRVSFCSSLALRGVSPRVAQRLMRHSSVELTLQAYTDVEVFDVQDVVDSLSTEPVKPTKAKPSEPPAATDWQAMIAKRLMETATPEQLADLLKTTAK